MQFIGFLLFKINSQTNYSTEHVIYPDLSENVKLQLTKIGKWREMEGKVRVLMSLFYFNKGGFL